MLVRLRQRKPIYKRWGFITAAVFVLLMVIGAIAAPSEEEDQPETGGTTAPTQAISDTAPSTSMATQPAQVATTQSAPVATTQPIPVATTQPTPVDTQPTPDPNLTTSQQAAVRSAESYLGFAGFSRQGLIDQLSSEFGDQYPMEDATVAVDSLNVDWNAEAVESANSYLDFAGFSRQGLIDQLSSEFGEQFTPEQATYAVDSLNVDWNAEAVKSATSYLDFSGFSCQGLIDQLSSEFGEQFTLEQATYAATQAGLC